MVGLGSTCICNVGCVEVQPCWILFICLHLQGYTIAPQHFILLLLGHDYSYNQHIHSIVHPMIHAYPVAILSFGKKIYYLMKKTHEDYDVVVNDLALNT